MKQHLCSLLFVALFLPSVWAQEYKDFGPEYQKISSVKEQKKAFVEVLLPLIRQANAAIEADRRFVEAFFSQHVFTYNAYDRDELIHLSRIAKKYRIKNLYDEKTYMARIAPIPASLVLAQAAVESAWGKSRFVELANNIFGEWTYGKNGIIPENRPEGMKHKIRIYKTLSDSIAGYMLNLNRNGAYREFRKNRQTFAQAGMLYTGLDAADTMEKYSGIGEKYNILLKKLIMSNKFEQYDRRTKTTAAASVVSAGDGI